MSRAAPLPHRSVLFPRVLAALLLLAAAAAFAQVNPENEDEPKPIPVDTSAKVFREVRSVPYASGAVYLEKGITGSFLGGKYRNLGDNQSLYQWQGEIGYFYTPWFSAGVAFKINAGEPSDTSQVVKNRYYGQMRFHKAYRRHAFYIGPQVGVENLNVLSGVPETDSLGKVIEDPIDDTKASLAIEAGAGWKAFHWGGLTLGTITEYSFVGEEDSNFDDNLNLRVIPGVAIDVLSYTETLRELVPALYITIEAQFGFLIFQQKDRNNDRAYMLGVGLAF